MVNQTIERKTSPLEEREHNKATDSEAELDSRMEHKPMVTAVIRLDVVDEAPSKASGHSNARTNMQTTREGRACRTVAKSPMFSIRTANRELEIETTTSYRVEVFTLLKTTTPTEALNKSLHKPHCSSI